MEISTGNGWLSMGAELIPMNTPADTKGTAK